MNKWYVAKLKPGAGREAQSRIGTPPHRHGENVAEQSIRDIGFDCYFPRMRREIVHHRTRQKITRRFPLLHGYIFISIPDGRFGVIHGLDGVGSFLGMDGDPFPIPASVIERMMADEADMKFDDTTEARIHRGEVAKTVRGQLRRQFRKGSTVRVIAGPFSSFAGKIEGITRQDTVKAAIEIFGRLTPVEFDPLDLEASTLEAA